MSCATLCFGFLTHPDLHGNSTTLLELFNKLPEEATKDVKAMLVCTGSVQRLCIYARRFGAHLACDNEFVRVRIPHLTNEQLFEHRKHISDALYSIGIRTHVRFSPDWILFVDEVEED